MERGKLVDHTLGLRMCVRETWSKPTLTLMTSKSYLQTASGDKLDQMEPIWQNRRGETDMRIDRGGEERFPPRHIPSYLRWKELELVYYGQGWISIIGKLGTCLGRHLYLVRIYSLHLVKMLCPVTHKTNENTYYQKVWVALFYSVPRGTILEKKKRVPHWNRFLQKRVPLETPFDEKSTLENCFWKGNLGEPFLKCFWKGYPWETVFEKGNHFRI